MQIGPQEVIWGVGVVFLAGQAWANQRMFRSRQNETNKHLQELNGKTYAAHRELGEVRSDVANLPCKTGVNVETC